ncbi:MAG: phosphoribosylanthranilate isomerase [Deltaproteobacteria bacterium]|nr:phosphoribosylanthranilate isomerase [Deltaproteobacteria bacterium]
MILVKICGITNIEDAMAAVEFGADLLGFNFWPESPRFVPFEKAKKIIDEIPPSVMRVGVFVNEHYENVKDISIDLGLDYLQFHGDELPGYCDQFATPYWKAFRLQSERDIDLMKKYHCDYYLVDAYVESQRGGTGLTGNWELARQAKEVGKVILAGGLTPQNVEMAIQVVGPDGVDVASGVEEKLGKKDHEKMEEFIVRAKGHIQ